MLFGRNYSQPTNNGLKELGAAASATDTELTVSGLTAETAGANALLEVAGIRAESGDLSLAVSGTTGTLTSGNNSAVNNIDFTSLGLAVGQFVHVGGLTSSNQFSAGAGYGRITAIAADTLTLDKLSDSLATAAGASETVDLLFGRFIRNVDTDNASFIERSFTFEGEYPNLGTGGATRYEYNLSLIHI